MEFKVIKHKDGTVSMRTNVTTASLMVEGAIIQREQMLDNPRVGVNITEATLEYHKNSIATLRAAWNAILK